MALLVITLTQWRKGSIRLLQSVACWSEHKGSNVDHRQRIESCRYPEILYFTRVLDRTKTARVGLSNRPEKVRRV